MINFLGLMPIKTTTSPQAMVAAVVLLLLLAVVVFASLVGIVRRVNGRRGSDSEPGICGRCGYSLRGLPSTICPECGSDTAVVGVRRPASTSGAGRWIACALWIALLLVFNNIFEWDIESYFLRVFCGFEYVHTGSLPSHAQATDAILFRQFLIASLMAGGVAVILLTSRKSRQR